MLTKEETLVCNPFFSPQVQSCFYVAAAGQIFFRFPDQCLSYSYNSSAMEYTQEIFSVEAKKNCHMGVDMNAKLKRNSKCFAFNFKIAFFTLHFYIS